MYFFAMGRISAGSEIKSGAYFIGLSLESTREFGLERGSPCPSVERKTKAAKIEARLCPRGGGNIQREISALPHLVPCASIFLYPAIRECTSSRTTKSRSIEFLEKRIVLGVVDIWIFLAGVAQSD